MTKLLVGVIFGGRSGEHEVSLRSAKSVIEELDKSKYEILPIAITQSGRWRAGENALQRLTSGNTGELDPIAIFAEPDNRNVFRAEEGKLLEIVSKIDLVFPVLHGTFGEDGTLQGLLELAEIPYVGAGVLASAVAMDKGLFKDVMRARKIPVVDSVLISGMEIEDDIEVVMRSIEKFGPYPMFAKPANLGSSVGITKCNNRSDLKEGLLEAATYDRRVLVELGIDARDIEVSVLGNDHPQASLVGEIIPSDEFYSYRAKYIDDKSEYLIPAPIDEATAEDIRTLAIEAFKAIDGAGMARIDFLLERESNNVYLNEINTIPGFTNISMYSKLWESTGLPFADLLDQLIELALERHNQKQGLQRFYEVPPL